MTNFIEMNKIIYRTNSSHQDFIGLVKLLDKELEFLDGEDHPFYDQFNKLDSIKHVVLAYNNGKPVACGAIKKYSESIVEIKRMFTVKELRGKGFASGVLNELENWASELGFKKCILETGINQPEAIALYQKLGYQKIENYGQYQGVETSLCFSKNLNNL